MKESSNDFKSAFDQMAKFVFEHCYLEANDKKCFLTEIEFYYHTEEYKDGFCKKEDKQLESNTLFFHYSGVDITFGFESSQPKTKSYGGILVRGVHFIDEPEGENGPLRVLRALLNKNIQEHGVKLKLFVSPTSLKARGLSICRAARIGLREKEWDLNRTFQNAKCRYFIKEATPRPRNYSLGEDVIYKK